MATQSWFYTRRVSVMFPRSWSNVGRMNSVGIRCRGQLLFVIIVMDVNDQ